ncbi:MAG: sodium:calcium antiporter [Thioalkalispiraceae bacterium]|jgi:cation:H+ antiporter
MNFQLLLLFVGLATLLFGTQLAVSKALLVARYYRLSNFFVGVVILALGSDLPELVVSINAALHQFQGVETSSLIMGNMLGSSFGQVGLIMGITGLFGYLTLQRRQIYLHGGILLGALLYLILASLDQYITRVEGVILVLAFIIYLFMFFFDEKEQEVAQAMGKFQPVVTWLWLIAGMFLVIGGSELIVQSTVELAKMWGVSQSFIAIIIIGIGSSLPELSISITAVAKKQGGMSVGNLIGSNIVDTLLPVGFAAMIHPLIVESSLVKIDMIALFVLSLLILFMFRWRRGLQKKEAITLVLLYCGYLIYKLVTF